MKLKSILVSQPEPESKKNPYFGLAEKHKVKVDFRPFIHVESVNPQEFRQEKIRILDHTAIILTSRNAVDHFFNMAKELRVSIPDSMKYFCMSEAIAFYLQKYVVYRKRKIFHGQQRFQDLMPLIKKHKKEKFLLPCSSIHKLEIPKLLEENKIDYSKAVFYKTVASDLSDLAKINYDMLVFFSPSGIESLLKNFPDFKQNETKIAVFGPTTAKAAEESGLRIDVHAPTQNAPSMTMAIEQYMKNGKK